MVPFLPLGNYFFPFVDGGWDRAVASRLRVAESGKESEEHVADQTVIKSQRHHGEIYGDVEKSEGVPYQFSRSLKRSLKNQVGSATFDDGLFQLSPNAKRKPRSLGRKDAISKLLPPSYSATTIPVKPKKSLLELIAENAEEVLLSDAFKEAVPLTHPIDHLLQAEKTFVAGVRHDIEDGVLDMPFAQFIIPAEFFQLSRALYGLGLQPAFSLDEAFQQYQMRLDKVKAGLPEELDAFSLVMVLQRYAENKYYPENGSGMLLDGLFHDLNDCEGGTKEVISYLDSMYPHLSFGSLRGMLRTTTGGAIGHMQAYIAPDSSTQAVLPNTHGLVIETTVITSDSIQPYSSGELYPIEEFVALYYPDVVVGTPLEELLRNRPGRIEDSIDPLKIVGTSNHPLKMSYGTGMNLLSDKLYDLENIRTRQLANGFEYSPIPQCNPNIDPGRIDNSNLFSNFVDIDPIFRKSLIRHYLADMELWDNRIMPQWKEPEFLPTYEDLAATLLDGEGGNTFIQVDNDTALTGRALESHAIFLKQQRQKKGRAVSPYMNTGEQECTGRALVDDQLLSYLFKIPLGPGLFFLPEPGENFPWNAFRQAILNDCLAVPFNENDRKLFTQLALELSGQHDSFRMELLRRVQSRGIPSRGEGDGEKVLGLNELNRALRQLFTGFVEDPAVENDLAEIFRGKHSEVSSEEEPSVFETIYELGSTGLNAGLVWDTVDFMGPEELMVLFLQYIKRSDLRLTTIRANVLVEDVVSLLGQRGIDGAATESFLTEIMQAKVSLAIRLAGAIALWKHQGKDEEEISSGISAFLLMQPRYDAALVKDLLQFGLLEEDAKSLYTEWIKKIVPRLPGLKSVVTVTESASVLDQIVEIMRSIHLFRDGVGYGLLRKGISSSLVADFRWAGDKSDREDLELDYGLLVTKMYLLALLQQGETRGYDKIKGKEGATLLFDSFLTFGTNEPVAKPVSSLLLRAFSGREQDDQIQNAINSQLNILRGLTVQGNGLKDPGKKQNTLEKTAELLGKGNILYRMLRELSEARALRLAASMGIGKVASAEDLSGWYLEKLHGVVAYIIKQQIEPFAGQTIGQSGAKEDSSAHPADFYRDPRVREAMALLAYDRTEAADGESIFHVKFRKTKDLKKIKDLSKLKTIKGGSRKVTRQDMSLLTLGLNAGNSPAAIADFWKDTLLVIDKHIDMNHNDRVVKNYLFSPHHPYLTKDSKGFFYPPEMVGDLHNASQWGGKNDILLSSYLHFKNLPEKLPGWLVETALARSEYERRILKKFERQTFYPMILECTSDKEELPDGLFAAKWSIRKPFGEDIFPGTLLLLRMGYMEIDDDGDIRLTAKGRQAIGKI